MREEDIEECFKNDPSLISKSPKGIAMYFYIQGELASSHTREVMRKKANFYRHKLGILDPELMKEMDKKWKEETDL